MDQVLNQTENNLEKRPKNCLYVDAYPNLVTAMETLSKKHPNFRPLCCKTAEKAVAEIIDANPKPDLVFFDWDLTDNGASCEAIMEELTQTNLGIEVYFTLSRPSVTDQVPGLKYVEKTKIIDLEKLITS
jgi:hypothetical protein